MKIRSLFSSSSGNSCQIKSNSSHILIDAGVSFKRLSEQADEDLLDLDALFITHDHGDHVGGAGVLGRKTNAPIYIHEKSYKAREKLFKNCDIRFLEVGRTYVIGDLEILAFSNKHDAQYCVSFIVTDTISKKKFGYTTDTGMFTPLMKNYLKGCDGYLIEANYDVQMMTDYEDYDQIHKDRVMSDLGHLSNDQWSDYIESELDLDTIEFLLIGHMSPRTNSEEIINGIIQEKFQKHADKFIFAPNENFFSLE